MEICFLALDSYPMLTGQNLGYAGGAEAEQVILAHELIKRGYNVSFITYNYGIKHIEKKDGIKIVPVYERHKWKNLNVLQKLLIIWRSLLKTKADLYFYEAGAVGVLPFFCFLNRKKFVYRIPSDAKVVGKSALIEDWDVKRRIADMVEIKTANIVVAQSIFQKRMLKERFGVESPIIKNGLRLPPQVLKEKPKPPIILWVGSISRIKRPRIFLELAKAIPSARFEMIGGRGSPPSLYDEIVASAQKLPNLEFYGFIPYYEINDYFKRASILVNTSKIEGFPNVFIQAWANNTPVVSLSVNPDKVIQNEKVGFCSGTFKELILDVITLLKDEDLRQKMGKNARTYVEREHDIRSVANKYIAAFKGIL